MELIVFEGIAASVLTLIVGVLSYLYKRVVNRVDMITHELELQRRDIDSKLDRKDVKEVVEDKLAPLVVTLQEIKKDLDEIGRDLKKITRKNL